VGDFSNRHPPLAYLLLLIACGILVIVGAVVGGLLASEFAHAAEMELSFRDASHVSGVATAVLLIMDFLWCWAKRWR
jgi:hypothetical protein